MRRIRSTSPPKSAWPGVSTMLILTPPHRMDVFLARMVMPPDAPVRDRASAEYALDWIDRLEAMARGTAGWRSEAELDRVVARFDEARQAYRRLHSEAAG
jgi:hypothetical protein